MSGDQESFSRRLATPLRAVMPWTRYFMKGPFFSLTVWTAGAVVVVSGALAVIGYGWVMRGLQDDLVEAYAEADAVCVQLRDRPSLPPSWCDEAIDSSPRVEGDLGLVHLAQLLQDAEVIDPGEARELEDLLDPERNPEAAFVLGVLAQEDYLLREPAEGEGREATLKWVSHLGTLYRDSCGGVGATEGPSLEDQTIDGLTYMLARGMSGVHLSGSKSDEVAWSTEQGPESGPECVARPLQTRGLIFSARSDRWSDGELLTAVWGLTGQRGSEPDVRPALNENEVWMTARIESGRLVPGEVVVDLDQAAREAGLEGIEKLSLFLLGQVHEDARVKSAARRVTILRGQEQLAMVFLLVAVFAVFVLRWLHLLWMKDGAAELTDLVDRAEPDDDGIYAWRQEMKDGLNAGGGLLSRLPADTVLERLATVARNKVEEPLEDDAERLRAEVANAMDQVQNSRWFVRWAAYTIPALGFIGTVRGILTSLGDAGGIVYASTATERGAAINSLAGALGLSFATTLIALTFGIAISYFNDLQDANEAGFLLRLEGLLVSVVDPRAVQRHDARGEDDEDEEESLRAFIAHWFGRRPDPPEAETPPEIVPPSEVNK